MSQSAAVVILNYNGARYLRSFLPGVLQHTSEQTEVIVADNASTDESRQVLQASFPDVRTIYLEKNYGFAGGYNRAIAQLEHDIVILLNSDIEVTPQWDAPLLNFLEKNADAAAVQPKILDYKARNHFEYAGAAGGFIDRNYFPFCRGRIFGELEPDTGQYNTTLEVFWATGACLALRRNWYEQLGGLDADFFAHMEEIDLCWRMKTMGKRIYCLPGTHVFHVGGGTLAMMNPFKTFLNYRNNLWMITKNHFRSPVIPLLLWRMFLDGLSGWNFLFRGYPKHTLAILKAHVHFYRSLPELFKKRRANRRVRAANQSRANLTGKYMKNVVTDYFLRGRRRFSELDPGDFLSE